MEVSSGVSFSLAFQLGKKALYPWDREPWRTELELSQQPEEGGEQNQRDQLG